MEQEDRVKIHERITSLEGSMKTIYNRVDATEDSIKDIKSDNKILHEMNINISVLATEFKHQGKRIESIECDVKDLKNRPIPDVTKLETDVKDLKEKPSKRIDTVVTVIITALVTGAITFVLSKVFGG